MRVLGALHGISKENVVEDAGFVAVDKNLGDDLLGEFWMALDSNIFAGGVHGLDFADGIAA